MNYVFYLCLESVCICKIMHKERLEFDTESICQGNCCAFFTIIISLFHCYTVYCRMNTTSGKLNSAPVQVF
jgi:hypothetical protein